MLFSNIHFITNKQKNYLGTSFFVTAYKQFIYYIRFLFRVQLVAQLTNS